MTSYRPALEYIIAQAESADQFTLAANKQAPIAGEVDGIQFTTVRAARAGKHAQVLVVECSNDQGDQFSCVLRSGTEAATRYKEVTEKYPVAATFEPELYGTIESADQSPWTVMERLRGVELDELTHSLQNPAFAERYARSVAGLLDQTASAGLALNDCVFFRGHNVMYDDATQRPRLIEQTTLVPAEGYAPAELMSRQLRAEVESLATAEPSDTTLSQADFVMHVFHMILDTGRYPADTLFERARGLLPTHPGFQREWNSQIAKGLLAAPPADDEGYARILARDAINLAQGLPRTLLTEDPAAKGFSPILIDAIKRGDRDTFLQLVVSHQAITSLSADQGSQYALVAIDE